MDSQDPRVVDWLLEAGQPWVRYRALVDLLGLPGDAPEAQKARRALVSHPQVRALVDLAATWPGYGLTRHNDAKHPLHVLGVLADFGLYHDDPGMSDVVNLLLAHQSEEGAFQCVLQIPRAFGGNDTDEWTWMLCDAPLIIAALQAYGVGDHPAVQRAIGYLTGLVRENGFPCAASPEMGASFKGPGSRNDPCPYASLIMLKVLARDPVFHDADAARIGVETLLAHWERLPKPKMFLFGVGTDYRKLKYPLVWYDILHVLDTVSRFPFAREDTRLIAMRDTVLAKQDGDGRYTPESVWMAYRGWDFGQKRVPSPWLTLLVERVRLRMSTPTWAAASKDEW